MMLRPKLRIKSKLSRSSRKRKTSSKFYSKLQTMAKTSIMPVSKQVWVLNKPSLLKTTIISLLASKKELPLTTLKERMSSLHFRSQELKPKRWLIQAFKRVSAQLRKWRFKRLLYQSQRVNQVKEVSKFSKRKALWECQNRVFRRSRKSSVAWVDSHRISLKTHCRIEVVYQKKMSSRFQRNMHQLFNQVLFLSDLEMT